jgi:hypothetical protein
MMEEIKGWFEYKGLTVQQHNDIESVFNKLINNVKPSKIIEIGTASGGLTLLLRDILDSSNMSNIEIHSFDNVEKHYVENIKGINVLIYNLFTDDYTNLTEDGRKIIKELIDNNGVTLVLCDGGNKINEFNILSQLLKENDIIMAHDYSPNYEYFKENIQNKRWNWLEIQDSDIETSIIKNKLEPYMNNEFTDVMWVCKIKK